MCASQRQDVIIHSALVHATPRRECPSSRCVDHTSSVHINATWINTDRILVGTILFALGHAGYVMSNDSTMGANPT